MIRARNNHGHLLSPVGDSRLTRLPLVVYWSSALPWLPEGIWPADMKLLNKINDLDKIWTGQFHCSRSLNQLSTNCERYRWHTGVGKRSS